MKIALCFGLLAFFTGQASAGFDIDCNVDLNVKAYVSSIDAPQKIGAERVECGTGEAQVVRIVKTSISVQALAEARSEGKASGDYRDSCTTQSQEGSQTCSTSGSDWDSCSDSDSARATEEKTVETKFTVAKASLDKLLQAGFTTKAGKDYCELVDSGGAAINAIKAVSLITFIYGQELMNETDGFKMFGGLNRGDPKAPARPAEPNGMLPLDGTVNYDGGSRK